MLPHYLAKWTNKEYVLHLVKARYDEHLAEDLVLKHGDSSVGPHYQELLVKHRLERAKFEVQLYAEAIVKHTHYHPESAGESGSLWHYSATKPALRQNCRDSLILCLQKAWLTQLELVLVMDSTVEYSSGLNNNIITYVATMYLLCLPVVRCEATFLKGFQVELVIFSW
jgi:hypothetical protein